MRPKVSIIIPVYNVEEFLERCVDSALHQTYPNVEIILVDDGSTDSCPQICDGYERDYFKVIVVHQINSGPSEARNAGMSIAGGQYVYFLDSDDYIREDTIEVLVRTAEESHADIVLFDAITVDANDDTFESEAERNRYIRKATYRGVFSGMEMLRLMIRNDEIRFPPPLMFFRRGYLRDNNILFYPGILHEDVLFVFEALAGAERVVHIPEKLFFRRVRAGSIMTSVFTNRNVYGYCKSIQGIIDICDALPETDCYKEFADLILSLFSTAVNIFAELADDDKLICDELSGTLEKIRECRIVTAHFTGIGGFNQRYQDVTHIVFYGAGRKCKSVLEAMRLLQWRLPDVIWDKTANEISQVMGIPVHLPDFESLTDKQDRLLVICIADINIRDEIIDRCSENGFYHAYGWQVLYASTFKC